MGLFGNGLFNTANNDDGAGGWVKTRPSSVNRHTLRADKLDRRADRAERRGWLDRASDLRDKADRSARRGGWF